MKTITIKEETKISGTDYVLEAGDRIRVNPNRQAKKLKEGGGAGVEVRVNDLTLHSLFSVEAEKSSSGVLFFNPRDLTEVFQADIDMVFESYMDRIDFEDRTRVKIEIDDEDFREMIDEFEESFTFDVGDQITFTFSNFEEDIKEMYSAGYTRREFPDEIFSFSDYFLASFDVEDKKGYVGEISIPCFFSIYVTETMKNAYVELD